MPSLDNKQLVLSNRYVQEYLCLLSASIACDGDFGPASEAALKAWRDKAYLAIVPTGPVSNVEIEIMRRQCGLTKAENPTDADLITVMATTSPNVQACVSPQGFAAHVSDLAELHLTLRPREVGPDNYGPWVRLYMNGTEGLPWCGGFVQTIWKQAAKLSGQPMPIPLDWGCTNIAHQAIGAGILRRGEDLGDKDIPAGSLFLRRKKDEKGVVIPGAWEHTGVVVKDDRGANVVHTIEGNTNDSGSRNGYEVCRHILRRDCRDYVFAA